MGCKPTKVKSENLKLRVLDNNGEDNIELLWEASYPSQVYHWWPMLKTYKDEFLEKILTLNC